MSDFFKINGKDLSEDKIESIIKEQNFDFYDLLLVWTYCDVSQEFIEKYKHKANWNCIIEYQNLDHEYLIQIMRENIEADKWKFPWGYIAKNIKLNEDEIDEFSTKLDFYYLSKNKYNILTQNIIDKYHDKYTADIERSCIIL